MLVQLSEPEKTLFLEWLRRPGANEGKFDRLFFKKKQGEPSNSYVALLSWTDLTSTPGKVLPRNKTKGGVEREYTLSKDHSPGGPCVVLRKRATPEKFL